jgi:hypothetical protein
VGVEKLSVSFDQDLGRAIKTSADLRSESVSAWLAEAARARLRREALADAVTAWEKQFGPLGDRELGEATATYEQAAKLRPPPRPRRTGKGGS